MMDWNDGGLLMLLTSRATDRTSSALCYLLVFGVACVAAYLLGSVNTAIVVSRLRHGDDIRKHGSGNAGLTNMLRVYGTSSAVLTLIGDLLKTALAVCIGGAATGFMYLPGAIALSVSPGCYLAGLACVIGHIFPIFHQFRGGKGVLATATVSLILSPLTTAMLFALFCAVVAMSRYVSLGSVSVAVLYPVVIRGALRVYSQPEPMPIAVATIFIAILVVGMHLPNLQRISERKENKFSLSALRKKTEKESKKDEEKSENDN